ncbi:CbrC family protein [Streptomyces sp. NPDC002133]|uniref:CbrC family protein n=1 Tax=Streptomyces sp. NPDC002133 TaxID=3154409 RepID=UPI003325C7FB
MGFGLYVYKFRHGDVVPMDEALVRELLEPYAPYDVPDGERVEWVRAADGSEADVCIDHGVSFDRPGRGVLDIIAELTRRTGAAVLLMNKHQTTIVTRESDRKHLPEELQENAVVVPPPAMTGQAIELVIRPQPEPRSRPVLPPFPYHPDPIGSGSVIAADERCACCGHDQGWIYTGPVYGQDLPDGRVCPYCIAFGTAAKRHGMFFNEVCADQVPDEAATKISERTPGFSTWQDWGWPTHCDDGTAFLGAVGAEEMAPYPDAVDHLRQQFTEGNREPGWIDDFLHSLHKDDQPTAYLFRCRTCGTHLARADFS